MQINGAVSGGRDNMDDHKKYGANLEVPNSLLFRHFDPVCFSATQNLNKSPSLFMVSQEDIPFNYLSFFLEDDAELEHIRKVKIRYTCLPLSFHYRE